MRKAIFLIFFFATLPSTSVYKSLFSREIFSFSNFSCGSVMCMYDDEWFYHNFVHLEHSSTNTNALVMKFDHRLKKRRQRFKRMDDDRYSC